MKKELAWILGYVTVLALTGYFAVSCASPKSQPYSATNPAHWAQAASTNAAPQVEAVTTKAKTAPMPSIAMVAAVLPTNRPVAKLPVAWDALPGAVGYYLYFSRGNQQWSRFDVGTNTTVNLTGFSAPMEFQVTAYDSARFEGSASAEVYYGASTNGKPMGGNYFFIASPTNIYVLSNAPLLSGPWTAMVKMTNVSGLRVLPLPNQAGRISLGIER